MTTRGLYIHIPFCKSKCIYCDFYSVPSLQRRRQVIDGLVQEWNLRKGELCGLPETVYIGGGTPSVLDPDQIERLLCAIPLEAAREVTFEANPDDVTPSLIETLRACGVNRLSLGVQSLDDSLLKWMRRRHDAATAIYAIENARRGGISNISADLIYGLPGMTIEQWEQSVNGLISTGITHLSAYCLTYAEGTPLMRSLDRGEIQPADDDDIQAQFLTLRRIAAQAGMTHYEISNFALPGFQSQHNSSYWRSDSRWLGIGPGAHSFDSRLRRVNPSDISLWSALGGAPPEAEDETSLDLLNDFLVAALRTSQGIDIHTVPERYRHTILSTMQKHINSGDMTFDGRFLAIRPDKWLISNIFMRDIILE